MSNFDIDNMRFRQSSNYGAESVNIINFAQIDGISIYHDFKRHRGTGNGEHALHDTVVFSKGLKQRLTYKTATFIVIIES